MWRHLSHHVFAHLLSGVPATEQCKNRSIFYVVTETSRLAFCSTLEFIANNDVFCRPRCAGSRLIHRRRLFEMTVGARFSPFLPPPSPPPPPCFLPLSSVLPFPLSPMPPIVFPFPCPCTNPLNPARESGGLGERCRLPHAACLGGARLPNGFGEFSG